jgi:hypothetical protein
MKSKLQNFDRNRWLDTLKQRVNAAGCIRITLKKGGDSIEDLKRSLNGFTVKQDGEQVLIAKPVPTP